VTDKDDAIFQQIVEAVEQMPGLSIMSPEELETVVLQSQAISDQQEAADRDAGKTFLDEETDRATIDEWYREARTIDSPEALRQFAEHLVTAYRHDYGTICHAIAAAALAGAYAVENSPTGGITGFQSGAVMWQFIQEWTQEPGPKRLVKYADLLYPQSVARLVSLSRSTSDWLQAQAQEKLDTADVARVHPDVWAHWQQLAEGHIPAPFVVDAA